MYNIGIVKVKKRKEVMKMKIVNLTPHNVNIINEDGSIRTIKASGTVARCTQSTQVVDTIDNIPITTTNDKYIIVLTLFLLILSPI